MQMLYNSDNYVIVQFDVPDASEGQGGSSRGGYEIVDKSAGKEIYIDGAMAASFKRGVDELIQSTPTEEALDEYIGRFAALMQQPVVLH